MSKLVYKGYTGSTEVSVDDGCLHGQILFINDIITYEGNTVSELEASFKDAVDRYLTYCKKMGKQANKPYSGTFNVRIDQGLHRKAAEAAFHQQISLNEFVENAIKTAIDHDVIKVEHTHHLNHNITTTDYTDSTVAVSTTEKPQAWRRLHAVN